MLTRHAHSTTRAPLALTSGEPAGIGPDLCVLLSQLNLPQRVVIFADKDLLLARAAQRQINLRIHDYCAAQPRPTDPGILEVIHFSLNAPSQPGVLEPANSPYVLAMLDAAMDATLAQQFAGIVTAPVHKGVINDAGFAFSGHTEYIAARTNAPHVVMMLVGMGMRVALQTTHLPLNSVAAAITTEKLESTLRVLVHDLQTRFDIVNPHIAVAGLNPHAGESGYLGREEIEIIAPVMQRLRQAGLRLSGPLPADTLFNPVFLQGVDCVLAMYHDQGLPVLKYANFGKAVNVTLGIPIIRTSVDHGTALNLAGAGNIDTGSLLAAIELAGELAERRT